MAAVRLEEPVASAASHVGPALLETLREEAAGDTIAFEALGARVRVALRTVEPIGTPPRGVRLCIEAADNPGLFPRFEGAIEAHPVDALSSRLVMTGAYAVPLGAVGAVADRTVLSDVAAESLRGFLRRLRDDVAAHVLRRAIGL